MIRSRTLNRRLGLLASALMLAPQGAFANPLGGQVVGGQAAIQGQGTSTVTVTQGSQNAIINWNTFNIGAGETTQFVQPNASSIALNRVVGGLGPSEIYGHLTANGKIFLINPNGVLFGAGSVVNTAGFLASTNDIANADFMAGNYKFTIPGQPSASIVNLGTITATNGGFAALVAPGVRNAGVITANLGSVALASGNGFTLDFYGDKLITLQIGDKIASQVIDVATGQPLNSLVKNEGTLKANGGQVALTAAAARHVVDSVINNTGVIEANSVGMKNGMIVLGGATAATKGTDAPTQTVKVSGTLKTKGHKSGEKGGTIEITGEDIQIAGAKIKASGEAGGGTVLIGGDTGGGSVNPAVSGVKQAQLQPWAVATASTVSIDAATTINASATSIGDGGKVVVWSNDATKFAGKIYATGGINGGNGGFAEVSSHGLLTYSGLANLSAPKGMTGTLLLDPANVVICDDCDGQTMSSTDLSANLENSKMVVTTDQVGDGPGNISVNDVISWNAPNSLTLSAYGSINVNALITTKGGGGVTLHADNTGTGVGTVQFGNDGGSIYTTGAVKIFYNPHSPEGASNSTVNPFSYTTPTDFSSHVSGGGPLTAYMLVNTVYDLQNIQNNLSGAYALGRNIDASATVAWNDGQGFKPIGQAGFTGVFNGKHHTIDGLMIAPTDPNTGNIGLFGFNSGTIKNVQLTNVSIKANPFATAFTQYVGALVGQNAGIINHVSVTGGTVDGGTMAGVAAGGLVGQNWVKTVSVDEGPAIAVPGVIKHSTAAVDVKVGDGCFDACASHGANYAGGLVGLNSGVISHSAASGNVTVGSYTFAGGLVGQNIDFSGAHFVSLIKDSYATGDVTSAGTSVSLGGLVGANGFLFSNDGAPTITGVIKNSHAGGHVSGTADVDNSNCGSGSGGCGFVSVGGLVGQNAGLIQGQQPSNHGDSGVVGDAAFAGIGCGMGATCASGMVSGGANAQVGGLVGSNQGVINYAFATGAVHVGANGAAGGLVGFNNGTLKTTFATGAVTGDAGIGLGHDGFPHSTNLGGLAGTNQGLIKFSFATGAVGGADVDQLNAGGLVGDNSGTIKHSFATGAVSAGSKSSAGGLVGDNSHTDFGCDGCIAGIGQNDRALISHSFSTGNVTVGAESIAGGFAADSSGTIKHSFSFGNVTAGHDSLVGGFVAFTDVGSVIKHSAASGTVNSTGPNSIAGGFVALNGGQILDSHAFGASVEGHTFGGVNGSSNSYLGGFVGINVGTITDSSNTGEVKGSGGGNVAGGFVAANIGAIDKSTTTGQVSSGPNSVVGAFAGGNLDFTNVPKDVTIPPSSFPVGTITNSTVSGGTGALPFIGFDAAQPPAAAAPAAGNDPAAPPFTGSTDTNGYPGLPSIIAGCQSAFCGFLVGGLQPPPPTPPDNNTTPTFNQQWYQQVNNPTNNQNSTPILINLTTGGPGSGGPTGGNGGNGGNGGAKPNYGPPPGPGLGRTADEQRYSGVPPPGETRFRTGELVIQVVDTIPVAQVVAAAQKLGLVLISVEHLDQTHRNAFRFRATTATANLRKLIPALEKINIVASVQPNYNFVTAQTAPAPGAPPANPDQTNSIPPPGEQAPDLANSDTASLQSLPAGDAAQYVIDKFHLGAVHRLASGRNVTIAVIDSEIDVTHPDLRGSIVERFDATQSPSKPHAHGTGMAGAIVSRVRLLGVAPGARILAIKAFDESANSAEATSYQILKGLDYAIAKNVRIINMSFAGPRDPMMERILKSAHDKGIILIAAAGNAGPKSPPLYPGADASVIAVSATDYTDKPFTMANRGRYIAVAAPGVDVMVPAPANSYQLTTGTSVAAAHVSGVAALILERKPTITPDELRALLMKTATAFSAKPKGEEDGAGLVDPVGALQALAGTKTSETPSRSPVSASVH